MSELFSPLPMARGPAIPNRLMKSAMSEGLGDAEHQADQRLATLYGRLARGGAGLLVSGNVMIDRRALGEAHNVVLEGEAGLPGLRAWAGAVREASPETVLWMQLNHPGKQSPKHLSPEPVAPSAVPLGGVLSTAFATPRALEPGEIEDLVARFGRAAALAEQGGFHGVQLHGAHGYLISQFLSPHHNRREDDWGGTPEKRRRFVMAAYQAMRDATGPDFQVGIKLNSADFQRGGFTEEESLDVVAALSEAGIDLIEISGGSYERPAMMGAARKASTRAREAYFLEFAEKARAVAKVPLAVTGGFRSGGAMREALASGALDLVGLARPLSVDPDLPNRLREHPDHIAEARRPSTGFKKLDTLMMLDVTWYEAQLARMGDGLEPDPGIGAWALAFKMMRAVGAGAFKKRRA